MGGNHKKNLRAEKSKVKLKGAKLPKGLNVTKTEFKVRKIVIRDQTRETGSSQSLDGQHQLNVKEILSRLKHHSSNFRLEALRKLREAILSDVAGSLLAHLADIIQSVVAITLDMDKETRRESYKTFSCLIGGLSTQTVAPFFHIISSYLRCGMTHIQPQLQEDSLLLLDVLLEHTPELVATHSAKIFQNFLEMISRARAEGGRTGARTLTVHMSQQQTTIKWRSKVLQRLQKMLQTLAEQKLANSKAQVTTTTTAVPTRTFNVKEPQYYAVRRAQSLQAQLDLNALFSRSTTNGDSQTGGGSSGGGTTTDEATILRSYVEHLIPLLMDAWLEVRPTQMSGAAAASGVAAQLLLSADAAATLNVVLQIIECLWRLVALHEAQVNNNELSNWLRHTYASTMAENFLQPGLFPYQQKELLATNKRHRKLAELNFERADDTLCLSSNVSVCYLLCSFCAHKVELYTSKFDALLEYLNTILASPRAYGLEQHLPVVLALRAYLLENAASLLPQYTPQLRRLLCATIKALLGNQFAGSVRDVKNENNNNNNYTSVSAKVLVLLCDIVQDPQLYAAYGAADFVTLLKHLPQLLLRARISESAILAMSQLGKQQNAVFLQALEEQLQPIIEHIQQIQVVGATSVYEGKKGIMNLFYWTGKNWRQTAEQEQQLLNAVDAHVIDKRIVSYYKWILTQG